LIDLARAGIRQTRKTQVLGFLAAFCLILENGKKDLLGHAQTAPTTDVERRALFGGIDGV
jgi:hypothetical protein